MSRSNDPFLEYGLWKYYNLLMFRLSVYCGGGWGRMSCVFCRNQNSIEYCECEEEWLLGSSALI